MNKEVTSMKNEEKVWEKRITEGQISKSLRVEQIENGFILIFQKWGDIPKKDGTSEYINITKKYFSKTNPLEEEIDLTSKAKEAAAGLGINLFFE